MKTFGVIGCGYIFERHLKAIKSIGGEVTHIFDTHDSVGIIDRYFPKAIFSPSEKTFFEIPCDYKVILTPNHLHEEHINLSLRNGFDVICEKPLCLTINEYNKIEFWEKQTGKKVNCILQLRYNEVVKELKGQSGNVEIDYVTPRGDWYYKSWKGDKKRSGGIATNIGVHLFDLLVHCFGRPLQSTVENRTSRHIYGITEFRNFQYAKWHLSTDNSQEVRRVIKMNGVEHDLSKGFTDLHTKSYEEILAGRGFGIEDCRQSIEIVESLR